MTWSVYIIEASDASLYTGISTDVDRRFQEHVSGNKGAKFFNGRQPVRVVYVENGHTRSSASKREAEIKKMSRLDKKTLIAIWPGDQLTNRKST
jgi:putative endonuclease